MQTTDKGNVGWGADGASTVEVVKGMSPQHANKDRLLNASTQESIAGSKTTNKECSTPNSASKQITYSSVHKAVQNLLDLIVPEDKESQIECLSELLDTLKGNMRMGAIAVVSPPRNTVTPRRIAPILELVNDANITIIQYNPDAFLKGGSNKQSQQNARQAK